MADTSLIPEWITLLMAVYALGASVGELVRPGSWSAMLDNFANSAATSFLTGIVLIAIGGAIYLVSPPWGAGDWLAIMVKLMGGGMVLEGFVVLAFSHTFMTFSQKIVGRAGKPWAVFSMAIGLALGAIAISRIAS